MEAIMDRYNVVPHDSLLLPAATTPNELAFIPTTTSASTPIKEGDAQDVSKKDNQIEANAVQDFDQEYQDYLNHEEQQQQQQTKEDKAQNDSTPSKTAKPTPRCRLTKCCICVRGVPESFAQSKPISWLSVCRLAMWALTQDGLETGRKWFSLGRDICPFVEAHRHMCGRDFTVNWKTTIGITMSTYCKKGNFFMSGNSNEHGLGFYCLPDDAQDPYLVTGLQPGRVYRSPSSALMQVDQELSNGSATSPETPSVRKRKKTTFPGDTPSSPPATTPSPPSSSSLKERKHTSDLEKQMLLDYYDKYGTNTTSPEYSILQGKLGWDHHRTKIWLYNRKTYHQKPGGFEDKTKRKKRQKLNDDEDITEGNNNNSDVNNSKSDLSNAMQDDDSEDELMYGGDDIHDEDDMMQSLKKKLRAEKAARKSAIQQCVMKDEQITTLEEALASANSTKSGNMDEEIGMLRRQVDLYCKELREEKRKRGEQEVRAFDYLAQINALKLRNVQLEKMVQTQRKDANGIAEMEELESNFVPVVSNVEKVAEGEAEAERKETTV